MAQRSTPRPASGAEKRRRAGLAAVVVGGSTVLVLAVTPVLTSTTGRRPQARQSARARSTPAAHVAVSPAGGLARIPLSRLVGQMVMAGMDGTWPDEELLERVRAGRIGGIILFEGNISPQLPAAIRRLQRAALLGGDPPLLLAVDQEGGPIKRLVDGPPTISPREISSGAVGFEQGRATGAYLAARGINTNLAPVADVSISSASFIAAEGRGFPGSPSEVADRAGAFAEGLRSAGVAATAKHFPGVGALPVDTDYGLQVVDASARQIDDALVPFQRLVRDRVDLVMVATAEYPALDASGSPAAFSSRIIRGVLRDQLGFRGVVITDALDSPSDVGGTVVSRAVRAAAAGADIALYAPAFDGELAFRGLLAAARAGELPRDHLEGSYQRILALKHRLAAK
jgi:beta-N-acetylhexosaminidase